MIKSRDTSIAFYRHSSYYQHNFKFKIITIIIMTIIIIRVEVVIIKKYWRVSRVDLFEKQRVTRR